MMNRILFLFALISISEAWAITTTIKDPTSDYQMKVNSDGSINTTGGGGGGGLVDQGTAGTDPWAVYIPSSFLPLPVQLNASSVSTTAITNVSVSSGSSVVLIASNPSRVGLEIFDLSGALCYVAMNAVSSAAAFSFIMVPMQFYKMGAPVYTGAVSAFCNSSGNILITEY